MTYDVSQQTQQTQHPQDRTTPEPLHGADRLGFDFRPLDDLDDDQRWSTWLEVEPLSRGPEPRPAWVVTSQAAVDTELGILKTGKEADAFLLERAVPDTDPSFVPGADGQSVVLVPKRYRGEGLPDGTIDLPGPGY